MTRVLALSATLLLSLSVGESLFMLSGVTLPGGSHGIDAIICTVNESLTSLLYGLVLMPLRYRASGQSWVLTQHCSVESNNHADSRSISERHRSIVARSPNSAAASTVGAKSSMADPWTTRLPRSRIRIVMEESDLELKYLLQDLNSIKLIWCWSCHCARKIYDTH